jgi:membrane-associated phospholipid phosphatase
MPSLRLKHDLRVSWKLTLGFFAKHRIAIGIVILLTGLFAIFVGFPNDPAWVRWLRAGKNKEIREIAHLIGASGSMAQYNFAIVIGLWLAGRARKSRFLQQLAVAAFLSTVVSGVFCNLLRFPVGRARPYTKESHLTFKGPQLQPKFHGFPSGHTSTAFGTAVPLLIAFPEAGIPVTLFAGAMAWARVYDKQHYPTDVIVGAIIGTIAGIAGGWPMLRVRRHLKRAP